RSWPPGPGAWTWPAGSRSTASRRGSRTARACASSSRKCGALTAACPARAEGLPHRPRPVAWQACCSPGGRARPGEGIDRRARAQRRWPMVVPPCRHAAFRIDAMPLTPRRPSATPRRSGGKAAPSRRRAPLKVDLALQGGGAHGAFTWGVLDRLLEEEWLQVEGISGTSAGAMNAAVLVDGYVRGGREGARAALAGFWRAVADGARFSPFRRGPLDVLLGRWSLDGSPLYVGMDLASRLFSPYDLNPGGYNPLRDILREAIDFEGLAGAPIRLF